MEIMSITKENVILKSIINIEDRIKIEYRKEYFETLEAWDDRQEIESLVDFLKLQTIKT
ncbi:MAG: hypothetical protein IJ320_03020 [Phascolarctobacterium sp.]|nr:hypothetical protein [Phascolarctobacterium sp.]